MSSPGTVSNSGKDYTCQNWHSLPLGHPPPFFRDPGLIDWDTWRPLSLLSRASNQFALLVGSSFRLEGYARSWWLGDLLAAVGAVEQHPDGEVVREVLEAVRHA